MRLLRSLWRSVVAVVWGSQAVPVDARRLDVETQRASQRTSVNYWNSQ